MLDEVRSFVVCIGQTQFLHINVTASEFNITSTYNLSLYTLKKEYEF